MESRTLFRYPKIQMAVYCRHHRLKMEQYLSNEITDNTSIIQTHARPICIKNASNTHLQMESAAIVLAHFPPVN